MQNAADLQACGFSSVSYLSNGQALFNNGHVAIAKDLIFGLSIHTGDGRFTPLAEGDAEELEMVRGLINKGTLQFPWWEQFNAIQPRS